jgi:hypothetical protein
MVHGAQLPGKNLEVRSPLGTVLKQVDQTTWETTRPDVSAGQRPCHRGQGISVAAQENNVADRRFERLWGQCETGNGSRHAGGELLTRPLRFAGNTLDINCSTSAAGGIRVEIQDAAGKPITGHGLADSVEILGDDIARVVTWKGGADVSRLAGQPVRLRFQLRDADLFSLQFKAK